MHTETATRKSHTLIPSDRVEGTEVFRSDHKKIGFIKRVMIDKTSGKVAYAVLSFGGFLGLGEKYLPVPWPLLKYDQSFGAYKLDLSDEELANAPSYAVDEDFDWGERDVYDYYNVPRYWGM